MDCYTGEIRMFAGNFPPSGWAICDGRGLSTDQYQQLFALIDYTYGGGGSTFNIPDLRGRIPVGQGAAPGLSAKTIGQKGGSETVVLTKEQLPQHTHDIVISNAAGTAANPENSLWAANINQYSTNTASPNGQMNGEAITFTGSGSPQGHNNMAPSLCINYIICLQGDYFPVRP